MGLETVKEDILMKAKHTANNIESEAKIEDQRIKREVDAKIEELKKMGELETKKIIDQIKKQAISNAELESKKIILESKKRIIEDLFLSAKNYLENLEDKKREQYIKNMINKINSEFDVGTFHCNKKDAKFLKNLNVQVIDISGGLIAEDKEKNVRLDYSFDTFLESIKERELSSISRILFH